LYKVEKMIYLKQTTPGLFKKSEINNHNKLRMDAKINPKPDTESYEYTTWAERFPDYNVDITKLYPHPSWRKIIFAEKNKLEIEKVNKYLSHCLTARNGDINIFPYPDFLWSAFNHVPFDELRVCIIGQDPYHGYEKHNGKMVPQAVGMSFSVPSGVQVPSSLLNIYRNQAKYKHQYFKTQNGDLSFWAYQGVLMLNTSLTVQFKCPGSHSKKWNKLTDSIIKDISEKVDSMIFALWGRPALNKKNLIDTEKHSITASSHPSGLSYNRA